MSAPFTTYLDAGLSVIPIKEDASKAPTVRSWSQYQEHRATREEARVWDSEYAGIAVVGGKVSGNLEVIDIDEPSLCRPYLEAIKQQSPTLYEKLTLVRTPRANESGQRGCHVYYRCEVAVAGNSKLAMTEPEPAVTDKGEPDIDPLIGRQRMKPRTLIETRGEGGYVLTVGCAATCHPSGRQYEPAGGPPITELSTITAAERGILWRCARMFDRSVSDAHQEPRVHGYDGRDDRPGDVYARRVNWADILEPHGWVKVGEHGGITLWRRPGKSQGWSATTGILSKQGTELLCVFSTNAHPFEGPSAGRQCGCYSKFAAFAIMNHAGDYQSAAKHLATLGYGTAPTKSEQPARALVKNLTQYACEYLGQLSKDRSHLIATGIPGLDEALGGGFERGEMIVPAAYSSHGKTAIAFQSVLEAAERNQHSLIVSQEMPGRMLGKRHIQRMSALSEPEWFENVELLRKQIDFESKYTDKVLIIEALPDIDSVEREINRVCAEYNITFCVVDYLQLVRGKGNNRYEQVSEVSRRLKQLAVKHNVVLVAPCQCSDREQAKANKPPTEHDLRDSGNIANDADVILTAHWPWKNDNAIAQDLYVVRVWKNRSRGILKPVVGLRWNPGRQLFSTPLEAKHPNHTDEFDTWNNGE